MRVLAPAKINLNLRVGPPRADGFHPLLSWMCTVGLFDTLMIEQRQDGKVLLECDDPLLPCDAGNLVVKAAAALANSLARNREGGSACGDFGVAVRLLKRIPIGAGLGGGSSDGARMLAALNALWNCGWSSQELASVAARLGSDVPFFFHEPSALCRGRGELVERLRPPRARVALLILPGRPLSTAAVYRRFDEMGLGGQAAIESSEISHGWSDLPTVRLLGLLVNDLEPAAFALDPKLGDLRSDMELRLGRTVRMSGSGSSLFTLFDTREEAVSDAARLQVTETKIVIAEMAPRLMDDLFSAPG